MMTLGKLFHSLGLSFLHRTMEVFNQMLSKILSSSKIPHFHFTWLEVVELGNWPLFAQEDDGSEQNRMPRVVKEHEL